MGGPPHPRPQNRSGLLALHVCRRHGHPLCGCNHRDGQKQSAERRRQTGRLGQGVEDDRLWGEDASPRPIPVGPRHGEPLHQGGWSCGDGSRDTQPARCLAGSPSSLRPPLQTSEGGAPAPAWSTCDASPEKTGAWTNANCAQ